MLTSGGASSAHDQFTGKIYGGSSSLSKSSALPTSSGDGAGLGAGNPGGSSSYKHTYDGSKSSSGSGAGYSYSMPNNQYIGTYMGVSYMGGGQLCGVGWDGVWALMWGGGQ